MSGRLLRALAALALVAGVVGCDTSVTNPEPQRELPRVEPEWPQRTAPPVTGVDDEDPEVEKDPVVEEDPEPPDGAVVVAPGDSIQATVDAADEGALIYLDTGIHRLQQVVPKEEQIFLGAPGAVMSGAIELTELVQEGDVWVAEGIDAAGEERGECRSEFPACRLPEDLFMDDVLVERVLERGDVGPGTWFLDHATDRAYIGDDPTGRVVELSVATQAFIGDRTGVTVEGLLIEKYATPAQMGTVETGHNWVVTGNEIRFNHGAGVRINPGVRIVDNYIHHNGQFGLSGAGIGAVVEDNEIAVNGTVGYSSTWAAGGAKFVHVDDLVMRGNLVYDNLGPGLWIDGGNDGAVYEGNRVYNNEQAGLKHEISGSAVMRDNEIEGNGFGHHVDFRGGGILIRESGPVEVTGNRIANNSDAIVLVQDNNRQNDTGNHLHEIWVHGNHVAFDGGRVGYRGDISGDAFAQAGIRFENNVYYGTGRFVDDNRNRDFSSWQEAGRDAGSTLLDREAWDGAAAASG